MVDSWGSLSGRRISGSEAWKILAGNAALAGIYFAVGRLGLLIPIVDRHVTLLWAPAGIALAAVLRFGPRALPGIALGAFLVNFTLGGGLALALGIALGNTLEAAVGAWLLRRAGFRDSLERVRDVLLLILGALASPVIGAAVGTASLAAAGLLQPDLAALNAIGYWWLGDAMGALLMTVAAVTSMLLAAVLAERQGAEAELREGEERLLAREREARAEAEAASEAKDRFLATLSHELRTPLTPVLAVVSSLEAEGRIPPALRRSLDVIRRNVELEARLIDDLLDLTRIVRGKLELHPEVTDVLKVAEHTLEICCEQEMAAGRLRVVRDLRAADHRLWADPSRLTQVLWNLVNNAVKFTPAGGLVTVRSWSEEGRLVLQVADTGIGIDPEVLPHVFGAFEQGRSRSPRGLGGLGLGLAISKAIVEMHGGSLTAESEGLGRGATFTVALPASLPKAEPAAAKPPEEIESPKSTSRNLDILLVEDHADTAEAMADLLSLIGHRVTLAGTVAEALSAAGRDRFDLVVSDLGLPDGSGLDVMRALAGGGLPGIALSGYGMEEDVRQSLEAGFRKHLTKPVNLQRLEAAIRDVREMVS